MTCSFCHKGQNVVGRLISSPSDSPRVYICDECVRVCAAIIADDEAPEVGLGRSLESHPLGDEALDALASWATTDRPEELARARELVLQMLRGGS